MTKPNNKYRGMSLDDLFAALRETAIRADEAFERAANGEASMSAQHRLMREIGAIQEEIGNYGDAARPRFLDMLRDEHPAVRLTAAYNVSQYAPQLATEVYRELVTGKYGSHLATMGRTALMAARTRR